MAQAIPLRLPQAATTDQKTLLLDIPVEIQLKIYSFLFGSTRLHASWSFVHGRKITLGPEDTTCRNDIFYTCKTIAQIAKEARLKSFDESLHISIEVPLFCNIHSEKLSNVDYADMIANVRFISVSCSSFDCRIRDLLNVTPRLEVIELKRCVGSSMVDARQALDPTYVQQVNEGKMDFRYLRAEEFTDVKEEMDYLRDSGHGHVRTIIELQLLIGDATLMYTITILGILYEVQPGKLQIIDRYIGSYKESTAFFLRDNFRIKAEGDSSAKISRSS